MDGEKHRIIVLSHANPDVDSIISGNLMQKLLRSKGCTADYIIPDKNISEETETICLKYGINPRDYKGEVPEDANLFLVDHYKTDFEGKVIGIIDHHPTNETIQCGKYTNTDSSSTAMLIYNLEPSIFNIDDIKRVAIANLIDTICFSSTKTVQSDKEWTIRVCKENGFDYEEMYSDGLCLTDITDLEVASINGEKKYSYNGNKVKSSYIQFKDIEQDKLNQLINILKQRLINEELDMWVFVAHNMDEFRTDAYLITEDNCEVINYENVASRGTTIMPFVEKRFKERTERSEM